MNRTDDISYALNALDLAQSAQDLTAVLFELRDRCGVLHLAYHYRNEFGAMILCGTGDAKFCDRFEDGSKMHADPILQTAHQSHVPVDWDLVDRSSTEAKEHFEALEDFGMGRRGMAIPSYSRSGSSGVMIFSSNHRHLHEWQAFRNERAPDLSYIAMYMHDAAIRIAAARPSHRDAPLSEQGKDLLSLLGRGKFLTEIAHLTGLSVQTVRLHINHAQEVFGCRTREELVVKAHKLDLAWRSQRRGTLS